VAICDFTSLYPSTAIAWNLCTSTLLLNGDVPDGVEVEAIEVEPGRTLRFAQNVPSLMPLAFHTFLAKRKETRNAQKSLVYGSPEWKIKEGLQLAYKVTANSLYGFLGSKFCPIPAARCVAEAITGIGRRELLRSKAIAEQMGLKVIYGGASE